MVEASSIIWKAGEERRGVKFLKLISNFNQLLGKQNFVISPENWMTCCEHEEPETDEQLRKIIMMINLWAIFVPILLILGLTDEPHLYLILFYEMVKIKDLPRRWSAEELGRIWPGAARTRWRPAAPECYSWAVVDLVTSAHGGLGNSLKYQKEKIWNEDVFAEIAQCSIKPPSNYLMLRVHCI